MQSSFKNSFTAEILKTKHTQILSTAVFLPLIIAIYSCVANIQEFFGGTAEVGENPWRFLCLISFESYKFLYPIFIVIICFKIYERDHQTDFESGSKTYVYFSKAIILIFCLVVSLLVGLSLLFLTGTFCSVFYPLMKFQDYTIDSLIIPFFVKLFVFGLSIAAIQLLLSSCLKNIINSVGIPLVLLSIGTAMVRTEYNALIPYAYSFQAFIDFENRDGFLINNMFYWSIFYSIFFFALGALVVWLKGRMVENAAKIRVS